MQVPGPYDHQPYNMTDGTYYEDRKEWQAFNHFAGHIVVITADGARLRYGYSRSDE